MGRGGLLSHDHHLLMSNVHVSHHVLALCLHNPRIHIIMGENGMEMGGKGRESAGWNLWNPHITKSPPLTQF